MRLIEKKCPNCGADLEFDENAKSCKCNYCKRSFEIERDVNDLDKINLVFDKVQKPVKVMFFLPFIFAAVIFIIVFASIFFGFRHTARTIDEHDNDYFEEIEKTINEGEQLITSADDLTSENLDDLERGSSSVLNQSIVGVHDSTYAFSKTGDPRLEKTYVAAKDGANYVVMIFNVKYHNFFNQSDQQTVYVPAVFENVKKDTFIPSKPKNPSPEYYFNPEKSTYVYGYASVDDAYNGIVKPYEEQGFTITEK